MFHLKFSYSVYVNGERRYFTIHGKQLSTYDFNINHEHYIRSVAMGKEKFFVLLADLMPNGDIAHPNLKDNIIAYDYTGKFLYNIGDIAPSTQSYHTLHIYENTQEGAFHAGKSIVGHEYLRGFAGYQNFLFDITTDTFFMAEDSR